MNNLISYVICFIVLSAEVTSLNITFKKSKLRSQSPPRCKVTSCFSSSSLSSSASPFFPPTLLPLHVLFLPSIPLLPFKPPPLLLLCYPSSILLYLIVLFLFFSPVSFSSFSPPRFLFILISSSFAFPPLTFPPVPPPLLPLSSFLSSSLLCSSILLHLIMFFLLFSQVLTSFMSFSCFLPVPFLPF